MASGWLGELLGYKDILINGVALKRRSKVNLIGATGVDNPATGATDLTFASGGATLTVKDVPDENYTLVLSDAWKYLMGTFKTGDMAWTIPPYSEVPFPIGTRFWASTDEDGELSIAGGDGVYITTPRDGEIYLQDPIFTEGLYAEVQLTHVYENFWRATGDLKKTV